MKATRKPKKMPNKKLNPLVGVAMGSDSDLPHVLECLEVLNQFSIPFESEILSAHRTPDEAAEYARSARERGIRVLIAAAGGAAHLPGLMASHTDLPVIGIPVPHGPLGGQDALLSIVQMPRGIPVATVAIGGAFNAGLLAIQILSVSDNSKFINSLQLPKKLAHFKIELKTKVKKSRKALRRKAI